MSDSQIILLGGNVLNAGALDIAEKQNSRLVVVDWNESLDWVDPDCHIQADIKAADLADQLDLDGLLYSFTSADIAAANVAAINEKRGLLAPSPESIQACSDKELMYECFDAAGLLGRRHMVFTAEELENATPADVASKLGSLLDQSNQIVVKPCRGSSSRGVSIVREAGPDAVAASVRDAHALVGGSVLVDTYVSGDEYSIEMLVDRAGNVTVWPIGYKGKSTHGTSETISVKVIYNPVLDEFLKRRLIDFAMRCVTSTGLRSSFAHLEVKVTSNGDIYPIEIAGRSTGFVGTHLLDLVAPQGYHDTYARIVRGDELVAGYTGELDRTSVYFFYDLPPGKVTERLDGTVDPFEGTRFQTLFCRAPVRAKCEVVQEHANDDTKKEFNVLATPRREGILEELNLIEQNFYNRIIGD